MAIESWLPIGFKLPHEGITRLALFGGTGWQILEIKDGGRVLLAREDLVRRWITAGLIDEQALAPVEFGGERIYTITSDPRQALCPVSDDKSPNTTAQALAFAKALKATRAVDHDSPLQDAIYVEKLGRLLPTYSISSRTSDDIVLGYWLTGGANLSVKSFRRARQMLSWLGTPNLKDVIETAGFPVAEIVLPETKAMPQADSGNSQAAEPASTEQVLTAPRPNSTFELPGRPELVAFFNEHVVDIVQNRERYQRLGIGFPSAIVLHGPPGCGKTFAVEQLIDFLGWPNYSIDASSVASPYIHQTSKKVAEVFEQAMQNAPSVLVIDEMEAFLADREMGSGSSHHRVEEVAEFLRRIPEATKNNVLIVAMTNRVEIIDPAILRRGRFDHIIKVDFASETEVLELLKKLLSSIPKEEDVDVAPLAKELTGRPLSDVSFIVREGARQAARAGLDKLDQASLLAALNAAPAREREGQGQEKRRIGFV